MTQYDDQNIFARILRGEIPNETIYEDEHVLAFHDAFPKRAVHALVIPKAAYIDFSDFAVNATNDQILAYTRAVQVVVDALDLQDTGYRLIANTGSDGGQEVPHFHMHVLGGQPVGQMVTANESGAKETILSQDILKTARQAPSQPQGEQGAADGPEPTRYGDWQHKGRVSDF